MNPFPLTTAYGKLLNHNGANVEFLVEIIFGTLDRLYRGDVFIITPIN